MLVYKPSGKQDTKSGLNAFKSGFNDGFLNNRNTLEEKMYKIIYKSLSDGLKVFGHQKKACLKILLYLNGYEGTKKTVTEIGMQNGFHLSKIYKPLQLLLNAEMIFFDLSFNVKIINGQHKKICIKKYGITSKGKNLLLNFVNSELIG